MTEKQPIDNVLEAMQENLRKHFVKNARHYANELTSTAYDEFVLAYDRLFVKKAKVKCTWTDKAGLQVYPDFFADHRLDPMLNFGRTQSLAKVILEEDYREVQDLLKALKRTVKLVEQELDVRAAATQKEPV